MSAWDLRTLHFLTTVVNIKMQLWMRNSSGARTNEDNVREEPRERDERRRLTSEELFAGTREILIAHAGQEYRLRITTTGKLILTK